MNAFSMDLKMKDMVLLCGVILAGLCLTTEACDIVEAGKCLAKAAKDALFLLPKFIKKPGPACEKKNNITQNLRGCLAVHFDDCDNPLQEEVLNLTIKANTSMKSVEAACDNSGCKDVVKKFAHIKQCYNETGLKAIFHSDTVFDLLSANNTNTSDTKLCKSAKSFEACLEEQSKTCPYLKKKFLQHVQDQDVANQAFDKCGIEITSNAVVHFITGVVVISLASLTTLLQM